MPWFSARQRAPRLDVPSPQDVDTPKATLMNPQRAILAGLLAAGLLFAGSASAGEASRAPAREQAAKPQFRITHVTPEYWRVTIDNPPFNIFGPESIPQLNAIVSALEVDPKVKVVVFDSAVPSFFLTHYDFVPPLERHDRHGAGADGPAAAARHAGAAEPCAGGFDRLDPRPRYGRRQRARARQRHAFREPQKAVLSQWEIGAGLVPGGGPMSRLPRLMGRGRALEVLLSGDDIDGELAQKLRLRQSLAARCRARCVRRHARAPHRERSTSRRSSTSRAWSTSTLPPDAEIGAEWNGFIRSVGRPQAQRRIKDLMGLGLQQENDVERRLADYTGNYAERVK